MTLAMQFTKPAYAAPKKKKTPKTALEQQAAAKQANLQKWKKK